MRAELALVRQNWCLARYPGH